MVPPRSLARLVPVDNVGRAMLALGAALTFWTALRPAQFTPDTGTYLTHEVFRAPLCPWILDLLQAAFGEAWPRALVILQAVLAGWSAAYLTQVLRVRLALAPVPAIALGALLLMPQWQWAAYILTEATSYALFLVLVAELLESWHDRPSRHHLRAAVAILGLIVLRPQFTYLVPVVAVHAGLVAWQHRSLRLGAGLVAMVVAAGAAGAVVQRGSNALYHGMWTPDPLSGLPILAKQMFLSTPEDAALFADPADRALFTRVQARMAQMRLLQTSDPVMTGAPQSYTVIGERICYFAVLPEVRALAGVANLDARQWVAFGEQSLRMATTLARQRPREYVHHVLNQLRTTQGFFVLFALVVAAAGAWLALARGAPWGIALSTVAAIAVANHFLIATVHILLQRYVFTTDVVLVAWVAAMLLRDTVRDTVRAPERPAGSS